MAKDKGHTSLLWLDLIKAIALIGIFLNHLVELIFGYPYIANPAMGWPPFGDRLAQLYPLGGYGVWNIPLNLVRYLGWFGEQGVQLFLIVSGFGLTWSLLARSEKDWLPLGEFYRRRAGRIYPLWWGVHLLFVATWFLGIRGISPIDPQLYLSMLGIRLTPGWFYFFSPAWWYMGLIIQLYLVYPLLWTGLRRRGPLWLLVVSCLVAFIIRGGGLLFFDTYLDAWQRGAIFITRLPEFVFGICLAAWMHQAPEQTNRWLRRPTTLVLALAVYLIGMLLSLTLLGITVAIFMLGIGLFVLLYAILGGNTQPVARLSQPLKWVGQHSYSLFLVHHPLILWLVPAGLVASNLRMLGGIAAAILVTGVVAIGLEWAVAMASVVLRRWYGRIGGLGLAWRATVLVGAVVGLLIGAELIVRQVAPQESPEFGWGERLSLEPDPTFGWRLKPSQETRLRWESYDYIVTANTLGYPGPEYPMQKQPQTLRILTIGDAFTSAEGVGTAQAWPRLLEADLTAQQPDRRVEVLNFGITGYGPNQYTAVLEHFAPIYRPDLIIIGFFVNDYQDVLVSNEEFQQSIGFDLPSPDGLRAIVRLAHLRHLVRVKLIEPLAELLRGQPRSYGYFLGYFAELERNRPEFTTTGRQLVSQRLTQIKAVADQIGARVIIVMIPAPVQVCRPDQLAYYPGNVDLSDTSRFDLDLPQRMTQEITNSLAFKYYDLRPILSAAPEGCPYQPHNSHWTAAGHQIVAADLATMLKADKSLFAWETP